MMLHDWSKVISCLSTTNQVLSFAYLVPFNKVRRGHDNNTKLVKNNSSNLASLLLFE